MGLDLYLASTANHLILGTLEPRLSLPDEGLTGVLLAIREFAGPTTALGGPCLDECGTNVFNHTDLLHLRASLLRAAAHFHQGPQAFQVWVGRQVLPDVRNLYQDVTSAEVLFVVAAIQQVVEEAIRAGAWLFAVGD